MKLLIISILFSLAGLSFASEENANPGINQHYEDTTHQEWVGVFESDGREVYNQRHAVTKALQLKPGLGVADIGAGTGFYSLLFAKEVGPTGKVFAVEITEDFLTGINRLAKEQNLKNIHTVLSNQKDTLLAPGSIDLAFVCATYHHFEYPKNHVSHHPPCTTTRRKACHYRLSQAGRAKLWLGNVTCALRQTRRDQGNRT